MSKAANVLNREKSERTLGSLFAAARQKRGLPIEKAAHDTRIRLQRLREIENNDFSQFSHPSYARLFLADYGRYLGIPSDDIKHLLPERGECGSEGYQYLQEVAVAAPSYSYTIPRPPKRRRIWPAIAAIGFVPALVVAFFGYKFILVLEANRAGNHSTASREVVAPQAIEVAPAVVEKAEPIAAAPAAPTEVGVDNAVPATETASSTEPAAAPASDSTAAAATSPAPEASSSPAAVSATTSAPASPAVSPQQSLDDHAALLVGGSTDANGRVQ